MTKKYVKFKNKNKVYNLDNDIFWKKKRHLAYGELRNFNFKGKPTYAGEEYSSCIGEYYTAVINKRIERNKNKININKVWLQT